MGWIAEISLCKYDSDSFRGSELSKLPFKPHLLFRNEYNNLIVICFRASSTGWLNFLFKWSEMLLTAYHQGNRISRELNFWFLPAPGQDTVFSNMYVSFPSVSFLTALSIVRYLYCKGQHSSPFLKKVFSAERVHSVLKHTIRSK